MPWLALCKGRARAGSFSSSLEQDGVVGLQAESPGVGRDFNPSSVPSWWFIPILGTLVPGMKQCTPMSLSPGVMPAPTSMLVPGPPLERALPLSVAVPSVMNESSLSIEDGGVQCVGSWRLIGCGQPLPIFWCSVLVACTHSVLCHLDSSSVWVCVCACPLRRSKELP